MPMALLQQMTPAGEARVALRLGAPPCVRSYRLGGTRYSRALQLGGPQGSPRVERFRDVHVREVICHGRP